MNKIKNMQRVSKCNFMKFISRSINLNIAL